MKIPPAAERSAAEQLESLSPEHLKSFQDLKSFWETERKKHKDINAEVVLDDCMLLRFLRASPGVKKFNVSTASKVMMKFAKWSTKSQFYSTDIDRVRQQLETGCFVIPGCCSRDGHQFLYMKPSKFTPGKEDLQELLHSLVYLMDCMAQDEQNATEGIAFMADMQDWKMSNFGVKYAKAFFDTLQGRYPLRVRMFLIVDPPSWFESVWKLIRPMMSNDFVAKTHIIHREELEAFVMGPEHVPDAFGGPIDVNAQLQAFIVERSKLKGCAQ